MVSITRFKSFGINGSVNIPIGLLQVSYPDVSVLKKYFGFCPMIASVWVYNTTVLKDSGTNFVICWPWVAILSTAIPESVFKSV